MRGAGSLPALPRGVLIFSINMLSSKNVPCKPCADGCCFQIMEPVDSLVQKIYSLGLLNFGSHAFTPSPCCIHFIRDASQGPFRFFSFYLFVIDYYYCTVDLGSELPATFSASVNCFWQFLIFFPFLGDCKLVSSRLEHKMHSRVPAF